MTTTPDTAHAEGDTTPNQETTDPARLTGVTSAMRWSTQRTWIDMIGLVAILASFWLLAGGWGAIAWAVVAGSWALLPPVIPVAVGQFALLALLPADGGLPTVIFTSIALFSLLISDIVTETADLLDGVLCIGTAVVLTGVAFGLVQATGLIGAVIGIVVIFATVSYLLHRLLLLKLGHMSTAVD